MPFNKGRQTLDTSSQWVSRTKLSLLGGLEFSMNILLFDPITFHTFFDRLSVRGTPVGDEEVRSSRRCRCPFAHRSYLQMFLCAAKTRIEIVRICTFETVNRWLSCLDRFSVELPSLKYACENETAYNKIGIKMTRFRDCSQNCSASFSSVCFELNWVFSKNSI